MSGDTVIPEGFGPSFRRTSTTFEGETPKSRARRGLWPEELAHPLSPALALEVERLAARTDEERESRRIEGIGRSLAPKGLAATEHDCGVIRERRRRRMLREQLRSALKAAGVAR